MLGLAIWHGAELIAIADEQRSNVTGIVSIRLLESREISEWLSLIVLVRLSVKAAIDDRNCRVQIPIHSHVLHRCIGVGIRIKGIRHIRR